MPPGEGTGTPDSGGEPSANGRYTVFTEGRPDPYDIVFRDVWVWDRQRQVLVPVSVTRSGRVAEGVDYGISLDGRYVAFTSADDLVRIGTSYRLPRAYIRDMRTHTTRLVSRNWAGHPLNDSAQAQAISGNGRVAFFRTGAKVVRGHVPATWQLYARNLRTGAVSMVSRNTRGRPSNGYPLMAASSDNGRWVAFVTNATNLDPRDRTRDKDIYLRDRATGRTRLVSVGPRGEPLTGYSWLGGISGDGRVVAFNFRGRPYLYHQDTGKTQLLLGGLLTSGEDASAMVDSLHGDVVTILTDASLTNDDTAPGYLDVYRLRVSTGQLTLLTPHPAPNPAYSDATGDMWPQLSRDGHILVVGTDLPLANSDTHVSDWNLYLRQIP